MKLSVRIKYGLLLLTILFIGGVEFGLFCYMLYKLQRSTLLIIAVSVVALFALAGWISKHRKGKVMVVLNKIIIAPIVVIYVAVDLIKPFITIIGTYIFVAAFGFGIPVFLLLGLYAVFNLDLSPETIGFIAIAVGSILCSNSYSITRGIIRLSPLRNWEEHKYERYREKLSYYLIQPCNVEFFLYLVYFVLLAISGFMQIQYGKSLISEGYDAAILKAFLVFIAFTNMRAKAQSSDLDSHKILKLTMGLFVHDDGDWLKQRFKNKKDSCGDDAE